MRRGVASRWPCASVRSRGRRLPSRLRSQSAGSRPRPRQRRRGPEFHRCSVRLKSLLYAAALPLAADSRCRPLLLLLLLLLMLMWMLMSREEERRGRRQTLRSGASAASNSRPSRSRPAASRACQARPLTSREATRGDGPGDSSARITIALFHSCDDIQYKLRQLRSLAPPLALRYTSSNLTRDDLNSARRAVRALCWLCRPLRTSSLRASGTPAYAQSTTLTGCQAGPWSTSCCTEAIMFRAPGSHFPLYSLPTLSALRLKNAAWPRARPQSAGRRSRENTPIRAAMLNDSNPY